MNGVALKGVALNGVALITNDDGIDSPGLHALARTALDAGLEVIVAAPWSEASGSSAAITGADPDGRVRMERREIEGLDGATIFAVQAAPAMIALLAAHGAFGATPDVVLSGINRGANVGHVVLHSGTVGAALTAGASGLRGLAVSLDVGLDPDAHHWQTAATVAAPLIAPLLESPQGTVLNVNVPNRAELDGRPRSARLAEFGVVQTTAAVPGEGEVRLTVADLSGEFDPESDAVLLQAGHPTLTALSGVGEAALPPGFVMSR
ncbi:5'/3'-nucleotidase SurE [Agromyces aerolatus]|uniref:5'/3'-nucleotidase SurE n=1 Tax=Agromyces sp. LY-1074 TaxID=3074080 RepID=UPI0028614529|nr:MULTISPECIES: 5'/3'-nucleotidase SurE [unclassified Agromyces]MDR5699790.1 5'/3'-nucleotidase SurE [Agromyces sp. LY-1074]MDR5706086.1 5'/3'-nucleotidase SurE [Agromyces sp. LY-1358]